MRDPGPPPPRACRSSLPLFAALALLAALAHSATAAGPPALSAASDRPDIRSAAGSGIFGRWIADGFGLPAYRYRLDPDVVNWAVARG